MAHVSRLAMGEGDAALRVWTRPHAGSATPEIRAHSEMSSSCAFTSRATGSAPEAAGDRNILRSTAPGDRR